tara:strand:- start:1725 stop:2357 length:633 start_codon:yes stop_codon:yes gene_type:complete
MAYPTVSAPYGLKPVNLIGGLPFAGATRQMPIASNYGTAIFNGDVVQYTTDGTIIITALQANTSALAGVVGVFLGCSYTDPVLGYQLFSQSYPGSIVASDIVAYVCDDPNALYKVASVTNATADSATGGLLPVVKSRAVSVSCNAELVLNTGTVATGQSRMGVFINNVTTSLPIAVVDVVPETANSDGNFFEFIVKINAGYHRYNNAVGV